MDEFASRICLAPADSLRDFLRSFGQPISNVAKKIMPIDSRHNKTEMFPYLPVNVPGPLMTGVGEALARVKQSDWADLGTSMKDTPILSPTTLHMRTWCGVLLNYLQPHVRGAVSRQNNNTFSWGVNIFNGHWPDLIGHSFSQDAEQTSS